MPTLILFAALGCGLVSGIFFAFSTFIMQGLEKLAPDQGIAAMQSINRLAITPLFMTALFATALLCVALIVWAALAWDRPQARWIAPAGALYLIGSIGVTIAANVPRNEALDSWTRPRRRQRRGGPPTCRSGWRSTTCARSPRWSPPAC